MRVRRIAVGVDGSPNSLTAVTFAADLATQLDAEVIAVHALGLLERLGDGASRGAAHVEEIHREFETVWCAPLDAAPVKCRRIVRDGSPVSVLLTIADEEDVDLIIVGSRGLGGYPELLLGSTSTQVAQLADRPVTIVPAATRASRSG